MVWLGLGACVVLPPHSFAPDKSQGPSQVAKQYITGSLLGVHYQDLASQRYKTSNKSPFAPSAWRDGEVAKKREQRAWGDGAITWGLPGGVGWVAAVLPVQGEDEHVDFAGEMVCREA